MGGARLRYRRHNQIRQNRSLRGRKETPEQANSILTALKNLFTWAVRPATSTAIPVRGSRASSRRRPASTKRTATRRGARKNSRNSSGPIRSAHTSGLSIRSCSTRASGSATRHGSAASTFRRMARSSFGMRRRALSSICRSSALRQALAAGPKGRPEQLAFITLRRATNVGKEHLGAWFSEAAERAGLVDCTAHGIRKAALAGSPRPRRSIS